MTDTTLSGDFSADREYHSSFTRNDRFSVILVMMLMTAAIGFGLLLKQQNSARTIRYESRTAGIAAQYPAGWLLDERGNYVARMRDPRSRPFKTTFTISAVPAGGQTTTRNILDGLTIQRSADLAAYRVLSIEDFTRGSTKYTQLSFAYVDADPNPFIQRLPVVILGIDVVIPNGSRSIIVTYMADQASFEKERPVFDQFFASIRY